MKTKIFAIALALSLAACLTACGQPSSASQPDASGSGSSQSSPEAAEMFYGRVSEVAGNELTLDLAKLPGVDDAASAPADEDGEMPAMVMTPATEAGEGTGGQTGAEERTELDYTGESRDFIIPGGLKITGADGSEKQLTDVKKGSVLAIFADGSGQVTEVVLYE